MYLFVQGLLIWTVWLQANICVDRFGYKWCFRSGTNREAEGFVVIITKVISKVGGKGEFVCKGNGMGRLLSVKKVAMIIVELRRFFSLSNGFSSRGQGGFVVLKGVG